MDDFRGSGHERLQFPAFSRRITELRFLLDNETGFFIPFWDHSLSVLAYGQKFCLILLYRNAQRKGIKRPPIVSKPL